MSIDWRQVPSAWASRSYWIHGAKIRFFGEDGDAHRYRPWLADILDDLHPRKVVKKARQIGASEIGLCEELWLAATIPGIKLLHTMPRDKQVSEFSAARIDSVVDASPALDAMRAEPWNTGIKGFAHADGQRSFLNIRSSWDSALGEGVDADVVLLDEYDRMRPGVEDAFRESLASSKLNFLRWFSTPTLPGVGIDALYERSDQRRWHVACDA